MAKHVKRSVIPIYLVGVVWLVFGLGLRLYQPVDFQMAAYTAAMRVLTGCDVMDGVEMRREAEAPGVRAAAMVDALIRYAQDVAEELLRPAGLPAALLWVPSMKA